MGGTSGLSVLLIGATGGTGRSVIEGMRVAGLSSDNLQLLTSNASSERALALRQRGYTLVEGNLDDVESLTKALKGVHAVYCHALSQDAAKADPREVERGEKLAEAAAKAGVEHIVYNGAGGYNSGCPMSQMQQKHRVQDLLTAALPSTTTFQGTLFMEEFWKKYSRPQVLKGSFPFTLPGKCKVQLVAVRDMGLAAATAFMNPDTFKGKAVELAGDELDMEQLAAAFSAAQGTPVSHSHIWWMTYLARLINVDLYHYCVFLENQGFGADVQECRKLIPQMLTFEEFLKATNWADASRTYESGVVYSAEPVPLAQPAAASNV